MPASNFSQLSNFVYNQQAPAPEQCPPGPTEEPVKEEEDSAPFSWGHNVRAARPEADQASLNRLLTRGIEVSDEQLHLNRKRSSSPDLIKSEYEKTPQSFPHATSTIKQDSDTNADLDTLDPRLFTANYDPRMFVRKSPS
ncbi:hypothetical protein ACLX1H_002226 [Fusarium chlamydosporum]